MPDAEQETAAAVDLVESVASSSSKLDELYSKMDLNQDGRQAMHPWVPAHHQSLLAWTFHGS